MFQLRPFIFVRSTPMKKTLLAILLSLLGAAGIHAQTGNVVMILFPGAPTGACSPISQALNVMNGNFYVCPNGTWQQVGGGGGGGISGTVSSPFVSYACAPDMLCDTAWEYAQDAGKDLDCYMDNNCQIEITGSGGNADFFSPGGFNINDTGGQNGLSYFGSAFSTLTIGNNGGRGAQIVLKDATMGSFALATDTANPVGAALEFTNVNTVGTGALDMSIFPDGMVTDVAWSAPGTMAPFVGWFIGPTTVKTIADIVDVNTTTLNPDTTGFPCGPMGLGDGQIAHFSDGDTQVWGATLTGGGAFLVLAYCNGMNWTVIGK